MHWDSCGSGRNRLTCRGCGSQAWDEIRKSRPHLPVLFVSGYDARDDAMKLLQPGQVAFLPKPYRVDDMICTLRGMLEPQPLSLAS